MRNAWKALPQRSGLLALGIGVFVILQSCSLSSDDGDFCVILSDCPGHIPSSATLTLTFSRGAEELEVRSGSTFEEGVPIYRGPVKTNFELPLGDYSARVRYVNGPDTILAFDGGELGYSTREECEQTCYDPDDLTLDMALKPGVWTK
jgi:hypothetical protein